MSEISLPLSVNQLRLKTQTNHILFEDISFSVCPGQIWAILGENGVGKSCLLNTIAGIIPADKSSILIAKHTPKESAKTLATFRAYLPQQPYFPAEQRVVDTLLNARYPYRSFWQIRHSDEDVNIIMDIAAQFSLNAQLNKHMGTFSGGQQQWIALAAIWAQKTPLILLDEPLTFLDLSHQQLLFDFIQSAALQQRTFLISLQDPNIALHHCTHALLLFKEGHYLAGASTDILTAENLSTLYHHPMKRLYHDMIPYLVRDISIQ